MLFWCLLWTVYGSIVNTAVSNSLDLTDPIIKQEVSISFASPEPISEYSFCVPLGLQSHLGYVKVTEKKQSLVVKKESVKNGYQFYTVSLSKPSAKGKLRLSLVYIEAIAPFPTSVSQSEAQKYEFKGNVHFASPYTSLASKTSVKVSKEPVKYSQEPSPIKFSDRSILYGPYENVPSFASAPLYVHYESNSALLVVSNYEKLYQLSHWAGTLAVKEEFELYHRGAALKGQFSRIDYKLGWQSHANTNVVKSLTAILPVGARNVYYNDVVGNVSTSHFRPELTRSVLEIMPRYPLYGGWKYSWFHGYIVSAVNYIKSDKESHLHVLELPLVSSIPNLAIEHATLKVVLPEGAKFIKVDAPYSLDSISESVMYSYFDSTGRTLITITKDNLVDYYKQPIKIHYEFDEIYLLQKPLVVSLTVFGLFVIMMVYNRLDLSITVDPLKQKRSKLALHRHHVSRFAGLDGKTSVRFQSAFMSFKESRDLKAFRAAETALMIEFQKAHNGLTEIVKETSSLDSSYSGILSEMVSLLVQRLKTVSSMHEDVIQFLTVDAKGNVDDQQRRKLATTMEKFDGEYRSLSNQVKKLLDQVSE